MKHRNLIAPICAAILGGVLLGVLAARIGPVGIGILSGIALGVTAYRRPPLAR